MKCSVDKCTKKHYGKSWCKLHYERVRRNGTTEVKKKHKAPEFHGMSDTPEYRSWDHMIQRCTNPNDSNYYKYGERGITVCKRWRDSFVSFYEDMGSRPEGKTLDRIDNNGDYTPENCRWATYSQQTINQRPRKNTASRFVGVYKEKRKEYKDKKWYSEIVRKGKKTYVGHFSTPKEAHLARKSVLQEIR